MTHLPRTRTALFPLLLLAAALVGACGGGDDTAGSSSDRSAGAGALTHADGMIELRGDRLVLTPKDGGSSTEFQLGPAVGSGTVQALAASKAPARVYFRASEESTAVSVKPAPRPGDGASQYEGQVVTASSTKISIDGDDGLRTFRIEARDAEAFDVPHLEEHRAEGEPVRVYYRGTGEDANAVAYEDA